MPSADRTPKAFDLGDILSITDGRLVSPRLMEGVYDILNFMTGDNLTTIGLMSAMPPCRDALLEQHPQLAPVSEDETELGPSTFRAWLDGWKAKLGDSLPVTPLASWEKRTLDADVADILSRNPNAQILGVEVPDAR